jgi:excisionase family DNA binding protein
MPTYLRTSELAHRLRVHPDTLADYVRAKKIPAPIKLGRQKLWPLEEVMAALENARVAA